LLAVWSLLIVLLPAGLAGCARQLIECPRTAMRVPRSVSVDSGRADNALSREIDRILEVKVGCDDADHDPITGQARWSYWVELRSNQSAESTPRYALHLTRLDRKVTNYLDRGFREDNPGVSLQKIYLDAIRADLHITPGSGVSFPCAENIGGPGRASARARSGVYTVWRVYTGDVTVKNPDTAQVDFVPVRIEFELDFALPGPTDALATDETRAGARRELRWVRLSGRCETCRPVIICESLGQPGAFKPPSVRRPPREDFDASKLSRVHLVVGLDRRPVVVDPSVAPLKRTIACSRWIPLEATTRSSGPIERQTDSTDEGLAAGAPLLTFHHWVDVEELRQVSRTWRVELRLGDVLDSWGDLVLRGGRPGGGGPSRAGDHAPRPACHGEPVFEQRIKLAD
jgi:hypothetical protein